MFTFSEMMVTHNSISTMFTPRLGAIEGDDVFAVANKYFLRVDKDGEVVDCRVFYGSCDLLNCITIFDTEKITVRRRGSYYYL